MIGLAKIMAFLILVIGLASPAFAVQPNEILDDPALEQRARSISAELRCMVCQNQSIDDSDAELARDLRVLVRERLVSGDTDAEVYDYVVSRYGEFVLLRPRLSFQTLALWAAPILVMGAGIAAIATFLRNRDPLQAGPTLTDGEEKAIAELLKDRSDRT
ncbi:cytochrome c-type biogenesis protein [Rhizobium sp. EC-SD404]|uniref:cytochrome c-type biogenesis protein n=1 Tax=Rhizobium sp. EC-SD404 TaxID=2038389 RepID=UPI00125A1A7B|nr:cytochrome c-type biogenesis protein [Rhizobium sp. EC-SD404]VVT14336.1 Cytochrome c-type biogenesis protein CcmH [Rhizobium sp. EC-SD404]